jgi:hypothetical protein
MRTPEQHKAEQAALRTKLEASFIACCWDIVDQKGVSKDDERVWMAAVEENRSAINSYGRGEEDEITFKRIVEELSALWIAKRDQPRSPAKVMTAE